MNRMLLALILGVALAALFTPTAEASGQCAECVLDFGECEDLCYIGLPSHEESCLDACATNDDICREVTTASGAPVVD